MIRTGSPVIFCCVTEVRPHHGWYDVDDRIDVNDARAPIDFPQRITGSRWPL